MTKKLLTISSVLFFLNINAQRFYVSAVDNLAYKTDTYQLNTDNCDIVKIYSCQGNTNSLDFQFLDIAIDTNQNLYYISQSGNLYTRNFFDTTSCKILGNDIGSANSLVADIKGNVWAIGWKSDISKCCLYKYDAVEKSFIVVGYLPESSLLGNGVSGYYCSEGDLFFYENKLFLIASNNISSFLIMINTADPSKSCYYMALTGLPAFSLFSGFSIQAGSSSKAYIISTENTPDNNYLATLFELNMSDKTIGPAICTYPFAVTGAASIYNLTTATGEGCTLPVKLLDFNCSESSKGIELFWQTAKETNNSYFLIERSLDKANFEVIGKQMSDPNDNNGKKYYFIDKHPGAVNYYRLKQVDYNGDYTYSKIILSKVSQPNPIESIENSAAGVITIQINTKTSDRNWLRVFDVSGKCLKNIRALENSVNIDMSSTSNGLYILQLVTSSGHTYINKFYKRF